MHDLVNCVMMLCFMVERERGGGGERTGGRKDGRTDRQTDRQIHIWLLGATHVITLSWQDCISKAVSLNAAVVNRGLITPLIG